MTKSIRMELVLNIELWDADKNGMPVITEEGEKFFEDYADWCFENLTFNNGYYQMKFAREDDFFCGDCGNCSYGWLTSFCPNCAEEILDSDERIKYYNFYDND